MIMRWYSVIGFMSYKMTLPNSPFIFTSSFFYFWFHIFFYFDFCTLTHTSLTSSFLSI